MEVNEQRIMGMLKTHTVLAYGLIFLFNFSYSQTQGVHCFTVIDDSTKNYQVHCNNEGASFDMQHFCEEHGVISMEEALKHVGQRKEVTSVTFKQEEDSNEHIWSIVCNYRVRSPKRYGGFAMLIKYRKIVVDATTGKLLSNKRIKVLSNY